MANELGSKNFLLLLALETTYKTDKIDANLTANTAINVLDVAVGSSIITKGEALKFDRVRNSSSPVAGAWIQNDTDLKINGDLKAWRTGSSGGEMPHCADVLKICGHSETIVSATSSTYRPRTNNSDSATVYQMMRVIGSATLQHKIRSARGVRGQLDLIEMSVKNGLKFEATLKGASYDQVTPADTFISAAGVIAKRKAGTVVTYTGGLLQDSTNDFIGRAVVVTIDGQAFNCKSVRLKPGNAMTTLENMTGTTTTDEVFTVGLAPKLEIEIDGDDVEYKKLLTLLDTAKKCVGTVVMVTAGCKCTISFPVGQVAQDVAVVDNNGLEGYSTVLDLAGDYTTSVIGENAYSIKFETSP